MALKTMTRHRALGLAYQILDDKTLAIGTPAVTEPGAPVALFNFTRS